MRTWIALLFAVSTFAAEPLVTRDVFYTEAKDKLQALDVHAPAQGEKHPVIVWIHDGFSQGAAVSKVTFFAP